MICRSILAAVLLVLTSATAHAVLTCTLDASGVAFGVFSGSQLTTVGSITIGCTGGGQINNATLTLTTGSSGTYSARTMTNGPRTLVYNLYKDPAFTQIFGDGSGGSTGVSNLAAGPQFSLVSIYGKLPAQSIPATGVYSDIIVATLQCPGQTCNIATTSFLVTTNVQASCTISATNLVFGDYNQAQLDGQSQISLTCTNGSPWSVGLNEGTFPGATVSARRMTGPGSFSLLYFLYRDAARAFNWGNTVGADTVSGTGTGSAQTITVYGRVPAAQPVGPGGYRDTIIGMITF
jgi:spore coat protein U-like protein